MRMPISVRRRDTLYDSTPYTPASASSSATAASAASSSIVNRRAATDSPTSSSSVRTFESGRARRDLARESSARWESGRRRRRSRVHDEVREASPAPVVRHVHGERRRVGRSQSRMSPATPITSATFSRWPFHRISLRRLRYSFGQSCSATRWLMMHAPRPAEEHPGRGEVPAGDQGHADRLEVAGRDHAPAGPRYGIVAGAGLSCAAKPIPVPVPRSIPC